MQNATTVIQDYKQCGKAEKNIKMLRKILQIEIIDFNVNDNLICFSNKIFKLFGEVVFYNQINQYFAKAYVTTLIKYSVFSKIKHRTLL